MEGTHVNFFFFTRPVLVFCAHKKDCEDMAHEIARFFFNRYKHQRQERAKHEASAHERDRLSMERRRRETEMMLEPPPDEVAGTLLALQKEGVYGRTHPQVNQAEQHVAYHHAGLREGVKKVIEDSFRDEYGLIKCIVCTTTLAQGRKCGWR